MNFVLDTNVLVYFVRSDEHIQKIDRQFSLFSSNNAAFISIVSVGEIRSLAFQFGWGENKLTRMSHFLQALRPFPIDNEAIASAYADIDAFSQGLHPRFPAPAGMTARNMGKNDLWIAATTLLINATLLTTDQDFEHLTYRFIKAEVVSF